jgi:hypothetical protein
VLSVKEAATEAHVCESIVRGWLSAGQLPHFRLGSKSRRGKILIAREDLMELLASFKVPGRLPAHTPKPAARAKLRHLNLA